MIARLAEIAASQVGVREVGGNNRGVRIRSYQAATNLALGSWPWCAAFVDWCVQEWLRDRENRKWLGLQSSSPETWRPKTASAFGLIDWAKKRPKTTQILPESAEACAGDIIVFDFSHCGIVTGKTAARIATVEGNTNGRGQRDSESGDGVWAKQRLKSLTRCYIRIRPSAI